MLTMSFWKELVVTGKIGVWSSWGIILKGEIPSFGGKVVLKLFHADPNDKKLWDTSENQRPPLNPEEQYEKIEREIEITKVTSWYEVGIHLHASGFMDDESKRLVHEKISKRNKAHLSKITHHGHVGFLVMEDVSASYNMLFLLGRLSSKTIEAALNLEKVNSLTWKREKANELVSKLVLLHYMGIQHNDASMNNVRITKDLTRTLLIDYGEATWVKDASIVAEAAAMESNSVIKMSRVNSLPHYAIALFKDPTRLKAFRKKYFYLDIQIEKEAKLINGAVDIAADLMTKLKF